MTFKIIVADPPWAFDDKLTMSDVARGAASNYPTLDIEAIRKLPVDEVAQDSAILALWCPASLLVEGLSVAAAWGFTAKTLYTWVKTAKLKLCGVYLGDNDATCPQLTCIRWKGHHGHHDNIEGDPPEDDTPLAFGMGRQFRNCSEHAIIATRGKGLVPASKSERGVLLHPALPHSRKPEQLQDALDRMYPEGGRLEMFARRYRPRWTCVGNELPGSPGLDIRDWFKAVLP